MFAAFAVFNFTFLFINLHSDRGSDRYTLKPTGTKRRLRQHENYFLSYQQNCALPLATLIDEITNQIIVSCSFLCAQFTLR